MWREIVIFTFLMRVCITSADADFHSGVTEAEKISEYFARPVWKLRLLGWETAQIKIKKKKKVKLHAGPSKSKMLHPSNPTAFVPISLFHIYISQSVHALRPAQDSVLNTLI